MMNLLKEKNNFLFFIIIIVAVILRFYHFADIPFTHDELSALFRTYFDNFSELIQHGVKVDGHPAGVQVFLYYWTRCFGATEWIVKLPFAVAGVGAVWLVFSIGKMWYNRSIALISAAFVASLQYPIMYSQIARPYMSGLFITLLMVYFWSKIVLFSEEKKILHCCDYIFATTLALYNHYFSFLLAVIVGITGLFLLQKKHLPYYIGAGVLIVLLFLPHLSITLTHLQMKGIESWLAKPDFSFIFHYFSYIFHHSFFVFLLVFFIFIYGFFTRKKNAFSWKRWTMFFLFFSLPIIIGFLYSIFVNAVLQYAVLIFSFPYLFFLLFGHIKEQNFFTNTIMVLSILSINVFTLIYERTHYTFFYQSIYEKIITDYPENEQNSILFLVDGNQKMVDYYATKHQKKITYLSINSFPSVATFQDFLQKNSTFYPQLYLGATSAIPPYLIPLINHYYPSLSIQNNYFGGETYLFSKEEKKTIQNNELISPFFSAPFTYWQYIDTNNLISIDSIAESSYLHILPENEWSCKYDFYLSTHHFRPNDFIDIVIDYLPYEETNAFEVVSVLYNKNVLIHWSSSDLTSFSTKNADSLSIQYAFHSIKLADISRKTKATCVEIYLWNRAKTNCLIGNIQIKKREGNPYLYGIFEKIEK